MPKTIASNKLTNSKYFPTILKEYNDQIALYGKINKSRFHEEVIKPRIPSYSKQSWYKFLKDFETQAGIVAQRANLLLHPDAKLPDAEKQNLLDTLADNMVASRVGLQSALNIGKDALMEILENPNALSAEKRIELLFKAMKAEDSRVSTLAKARSDNREEILFNKALDEAIY